MNYVDMNLISLVSIHMVKHLLKGCLDHQVDLEVQLGVDKLGQQHRHHSGGQDGHSQPVLLVAQHHSVNIWSKSTPHQNMF